MSIESRVRRIYERRPYPPPELRRKGERWSLPPLEWIVAVSDPERPPVRRILVAGCGVGSEAFAFVRRFPAAEVVGVDFSARSIETARRLQRRVPGCERIQFEVADLTDSRLPEITGGDFDLVSCHGVLSYIPDPVGALRNLSHAMSKWGTLVLGVNGALHPSLRYRKSLPMFGLDPGEFHDSKRTREVLAIHDSIVVYPPVQLAGMSPAYIASDIFGPLNHSLPLTEWSRMCRKAGLHLRSNFYANIPLRQILNRSQQRLLLPRSRPAVCELFDLIQPGSFYRTVYSRQRPKEPDWADGRSLLDWKPLVTPLFTFELPARGGAWHNLRQVTLASKAINTKVTLRVPRWQIEILNQSSGEKSLREILRGVKPKVSPRELSEQMYILHQLAVINLLPPGAGGPKPVSS